MHASIAQRTQIVSSKTSIADVSAVKRASRVAKVRATPERDERSDRDTIRVS
jgi:hypothetical protein|tara:strand:+ start:25714 stop:25869 length:156 start_codon:yes stop_codon:yes gene_type:complete